MNLKRLPSHTAMTRLSLSVLLIAAQVLPIVNCAPAFSQPVGDEFAPAPRLEWLSSLTMRGSRKPEEDHSSDFKLEISRKPAQAAEESAARKPVKSQTLTAARIEALIKRLPPLRTEKSEQTAFVLPEQSLVRPTMPGTVVRETFPPTKLSPTKPAAAAVHLATVERISHSGKANQVSELAISFSQPMVPLTDLSTVNDIAKLPLKMTPQPAGHWQWTGCQTLIFQPLNKEKRLPNATTYKIETVANAHSAAGGVLKPWSSSLTTPVARVLDFSPPSGIGTETRPIMVALFNQHVNTADVLHQIQVTEVGSQNTFALDAVPFEELTKNQDRMARLALKNARDHLVAFRAREAFAGDKRILVVIPSCPSAEGPLKGKDTQRFSFTTHGPLRLVYHTPSKMTAGWNSILSFRFNNEIDPAKFTFAKVKLAPEPGDRHVIQPGQEIIITGRFKANTKYVVSFDKDLTDVFGQKLGKTTGSTVLTGPARPFIDDKNDSVVIIPRSATPNYQFMAGGMRAVKVTLTEVDIDECRRLFANPNFTDSYRHDGPLKLHAPPIYTHTYPVGADFATVRLDLKPFLTHGSGRIAALIEPVGAPKDEYTSLFRQLLLQVTDIGLDVYDDAQFSVAATSFMDGTPISGTRVSLFGSVKSLNAAKGKPIAPGGMLVPEPAPVTTNSDGIAKFPISSKPFRAVLATNGADSVIVPVQDSNVSELLKPCLAWYQATDRGLYRPGEKVSVKGWVRGTKRGAHASLHLFKAPVNLVHWSVSIESQKLASGQVEPDASGGFTFDFKVPPHSQLGYGTIEIRADVVDPKSEKTRVPALLKDYNAVSLATQGFFRVDELRPPEFEMHVKAAEGTSRIIGDPITLTADAHYFAGGALANSPVSWDVTASRSQYSPSGWSDFAFGDPRMYWNNAHTSLAGQTNVDGKDSIEVKLLEEVSPFPLSCSFEATVHDINRQTWSDRTGVLIHPASVYVGIKNEQNLQLPGKPFAASLIVVDLDGHAISNKDVKLELRTARDSQPPNVLIVSEKITSADTPIAVKFGGQKAGQYVLEATVTDEHGRANRSRSYFSVRDDNLGSQALVERSLVLTPDRAEYKPGDVANISVSSPFAPTQCLLTIGSQGIGSMERIAEDSTNFSIKIPVTEEFFPSATVRLDAVGKNLAFASGTVQLTVPPNARKLTVAVTPGAKELSPASDTTLKFNLTDAVGKPVSGQVAVAVVDEAILASAGYSWANPLNTFYQVNGMGWQIERNRAHVYLGRDANLIAKNPAPQNEMAALPPPSPSAHLASLPSPSLPSAAPAESRVRAGYAPSLQGATNGTIGPQGTDATYSGSNVLTGAFGQGKNDAYAAPKKIAVRENFDLTALFKAAVETDQNGQAEVKLHMPDSVGRFRIMAVAVSGNDLFGSSDSTITVRAPLMVKPSAPRFLNMGDSFELPVVLQNQTDTALNVDVVARAQNADLGDAEKQSPENTALEQSGQSVEVPAHDRVEVRFPGRAKLAGTSRFQFGASAGQYDDAAEISLPTMKPASFESFAAYGQIDKGMAVQKIQAPADVIPDFGGVSVSTSSTAVQSLTDAYFYLKDYQLECSEQISARLLGMLALEKVSTAFGTLSASDKAKYSERIKLDIKSLVTRQRSDGSVALWSSFEHDDWPYVALQVSRALFLAKDKGYAVPSETLTRCSLYLGQIDVHTKKESYSDVVIRACRAYALYLKYLNKDVEPELAAATVREAVKEALPTASYSSGILSKVPLDDLNRKLSIESAAWLLPVLTKSTNHAAEAALLSRLIASSVSETASTASSVGTAYSGDGYRLFYSHGRQTAMVLDALMRSDPSSDLIPKLVKGLLAHRKQGKWEGTQENACTILALSEYFGRYEKVTPNFDAQLWLGDTFVGNHKFVGHTTETANVDIPLKFILARATQDFLINKVGPGRLYYRLGMDYVPKSFSLPAADYGFTVLRSYEGVDNPADVRRDHDGIWHFKAGSAVRTKLAISAPGNRYHVALLDPLAAGTEPLNPALMGTQTMLFANNGSSDGTIFVGTKVLTPQTMLDESVDLVGSTLSGGIDALPPPPDDSLEDDYSALRTSWWYDCWYEHQNLRNHQAEVFSSLLYPGTYTYNYTVRATTPGTYIVPPCKAEEMYQPETFGRTATDHVIVE